MSAEPTRRRSLDQRHAGSYYHPHFDAHIVKVMLGQHKISARADEMLVTTLGSCIAACIRDPVAGVGGMNHFLLPEVPEGACDSVNVAARYGGTAMELLINHLLGAGARRNRLEIKVFGGAKVIESTLDVGAKNAEFVLSYIRNEGLHLVGQDLGGLMARRVHYFPSTGRVLRRVLRHEAMSETVSQELNYMSTLRQKPIEGDIELFGDD